ncbi:sugar translocase [Lentzea sp. NBRC 105346]|nr:sugar translocase [Lentzea sp. NBRC 105346]
MISRFPEPIRSIALKHRELVKFALVGGTCFVIDTAIFVVLKTTVLLEKPVTAKIIATLVATIVSYVLNREWSFKTRGGRERHHEAALFFLVNGIGIVLNSMPLWVSRYVFDLEEPFVSRAVQEIADFTSAQIIGTLVAMAFRWYGYKKWVFPEADARPRRGRSTEDEEMLGHS